MNASQTIANIPMPNVNYGNCVFITRSLKTIELLNAFGKFEDTFQALKYLQTLRIPNYQRTIKQN